MIISKRALIVCLVAALSGCAGQAARESDVRHIAEAENRLRAGDYAGAARIYYQLADYSSAPDYYRMMAADAELRAGNGRVAQSLLHEVKPDKLIVPEQYRYALLQSRLYLNEGNARAAMGLLDTLSPQQLEPSARAHYHTLRASAYNQLGNMLESARERVLLEPFLRTQEAVNKNHEAIIDELKQVPEPVLTGMVPARPDVLGGWMELSGILRGPKKGRDKSIAAWRQKYPGHPADGAFVAGFLGKDTKPVEVKPLKAVPEPTAPPAPVASEPNAAPQVSQQDIAPAATPQPSPAHLIGVMLPLTGAYGAAGQAIRLGLQSAADADTRPDKPSLKFVDTQAGNVAELYKQLANERARWVVGPLIKEELASLANNSDLSVPVLALNQNPEVSRDNLYQFALTPEQEVEQSAGSAWFDGHQNALVLAPASAFGQRMINHFSGYWKSLGGKISSIKTYRPGGEDFTATVRDLLNAIPGGLASSTAPPASPPTVNPVNSANFVFLVGDARDARLLRPQLETQQGFPLPIYATSHVFGGRPESENLDQDLTGVIFCDIPWLLNADAGGALSRQNLQSAVQQTPENYLRLVAFGIDAYQLIPQIEPMKERVLSRYSGVTGQLTLQTGNRIQRQLDCAQFQGGVPQTRGAAPLLQPSAGAASGPGTP